MKNKREIDRITPLPELEPQHGDESPDLAMTCSDEEPTCLPCADEETACLAYSYWEARDRQGGSPDEDWLRAEEELKRQRDTKRDRSLDTETGAYDVATVEGLNKSPAQAES